MTDPYQYYPTPAALSQKAWAMFKNTRFVRVLEPSAGAGHLLKAKPSEHGQRLPIDCIEIDIRKHSTLRDAGFAIRGKHGRRQALGVNALISASSNQAIILIQPRAIPYYPSRGDEPFSP